MVDLTEHNVQVHIFNEKYLLDEMISPQNNICTLFKLTQHINHEHYLIIHFNTSTHIYIPTNLKEILGIKTMERKLSSHSLMRLIHPDDLRVVSISYQNMYQFVINNSLNLKDGAKLFTINFRIKNYLGNYLKIICSNQLLDKHEKKNIFTIYSHCCISKQTTIKNSHIFENECSNSFTQRELEIIQLLASGKNSLEIGSLLHISKHTVDTHRRKMLAKSHFSNTTQLVANIVSNGGKQNE